MLWSIIKNTNQPIHESLRFVADWPHTITYVVSLRQRYDSLLELTEPPPEEWWDHPDLIRRHIEKLYPSNSKGSSVAEVDIEEIED